MILREAQVNDISQIQSVRHAVKENVLSDPALVKDEDVKTYICERGKGWVCLVDEVVVGFSIIDLQDQNVWALFVHPAHEQKGIGKRLHDTMMNWYFKQTKERAWLSTDPGTRAERFYRMNGWKQAGVYGKGEIKFEMEAPTL
jgi:GNAT superfamily N-acetyltransferase